MNHEEIRQEYDEKRADLRERHHALLVKINSQSSKVKAMLLPLVERHFAGCEKLEGIFYWEKRVELMQPEKEELIDVLSTTGDTIGELEAGAEIRMVTEDGDEEEDEEE